MAVNPPSITWVHERDAASYDLEWSRRADFSAAEAARGLPWSVYTHDRALAPGTYYWRYRITPIKGAPSAWSRTRSFRIPAEAVEFPKPTMAQLRARIPRRHPRLFVTAEELPRLKTLPAVAALRRRAADVMKSEPTPEPTEMGSSRNPADGAVLVVQPRADAQGMQRGGTARVRLPAHARTRIRAGGAQVGAAPGRLEPRRSHQLAPQRRGGHAHPASPGARLRLGL